MITDGRFSGGTTGLCVGHVSPESFDDGPISLCNDGDLITLDIDKRVLDIDIDEDEMNRRKEKYRKPSPRYTSGALYKYSLLVSGSDKGAVTG